MTSYKRKKWIWKLIKAATDSVFLESEHINKQPRKLWNHQTVNLWGNCYNTRQAAFPFYWRSNDTALVWKGARNVLNEFGVVYLITRTLMSFSPWTIWQRMVRMDMATVSNCSLIASPPFVFVIALWLHSFTIASKIGWKNMWRHTTLYERCQRVTGCVIRVHFIDSIPEQVKSRKPRISLTNNRLEVVSYLLTGTYLLHVLQILYRVEGTGIIWARLAG